MFWLNVFSEVFLNLTSDLLEKVLTSCQVAVPRLDWCIALLNLCIVHIVFVCTYVCSVDANVCDCIYVHMVMLL